MSDKTECCDCGMLVDVGEYHSFAVCLMFKACHDSRIVYANLNAMREDIRRYYSDEITTLQTKLAEVENDRDSLRADDKSLRAHIELLESDGEKLQTKLEAQDKALRELVEEWRVKGQNVRTLFPPTAASTQLEWQWKECANELQAILDKK